MGRSEVVPPPIVIRVDYIEGNTYGPGKGTRQIVLWNAIESVGDETTFWYVCWQNSNDPVKRTKDGWIWRPGVFHDEREVIVIGKAYAESRTREYSDKGWPFVHFSEIVK